MLQAKKAYRKKRNHSDSDSDEDDDYRIFVAPTDVSVAWGRERQAPRRSLREHTKKKIYYQEEELEREDEKYQNEVKEMKSKCREWRQRKKRTEFSRYLLREELLGYKRVGVVGVCEE